jgi:uncharacterized protein with HEPN domain
VSRSVEDRLRDAISAVDRAIQADGQLAAAVEVGDEAGTEVAFDAILHNLFIIGEAIKALPKAVTEQERDVPWEDIAGMRDIIGHHYHRIVPSIIHATIEHDVDPLRAALVRLLASGPSQAPE